MPCLVIVRTHRLTLPLGKGRIPSPPRSMQQRSIERPSLHDESGDRYAADRLYEESEPDRAVANHESSFRIRF